MAMCSSLHHLRGHVLNCATEGVRSVFRFMGEEVFAEAKVCQNYVAIWVQEDVFKLDISIDDAKLQ